MQETDGRLIILSKTDTIAVARCFIPEGETLVVNGQSVTLDRAVALGHKIAVTPMQPGQKVLKYGVSIGSVTASIPTGAHVHLHNMKSDYTATYALDTDGAQQ